VNNPVLGWRACHFRPDLPVLMIGQSWNRTSMINALDAGVDEIVVGKIRTEEIVARARHAVDRRRGTPKPVNRFTLGAATLNESTLEVITAHKRVRLTAREFTIACLFFSNPGRLITRKELANAAWGKDLDIVGRSLEQHIYKLRRKLELHDHSELQLKTSYSLGYALEHSPVHHRDTCAARVTGTPPSEAVS
jgi:DNA-binding response OmpR family regulator